MIRKHCPEYLKALLESLSIPQPDYDDDEMRVYEKLDRAINKQACAMMKSLALITGYLKLLKLAKVKLKGTEDNDELIAHIVENEEALIKASDRKPPKLPPDLERSLLVEETEVMIVPIVFGSIFSIMTFFYTMFAETYFPMVTLIGTVAGMGCIILGLRGEKHVKLAAPAERFVQLPPDVLSKEEMIATLEMLKTVDKINKVLRPPEPEPVEGEGDGDGEATPEAPV